MLKMNSLTEVLPINTVPHSDFDDGKLTSFLFQEGLVYAVEFSHRSGRDLINVAKKRTNIIPIIEDARHPLKYR